LIAQGQIAGRQGCAYVCTGGGLGLHFGPRLCERVRLCRMAYPCQCKIALTMQNDLCLFRRRHELLGYPPHLRVFGKASIAWSDRVPAIEHGQGETARGPLPAVIAWSVDQFDAI
jgi:hypothetical protein